MQEDTRSVGAKSSAELKHGARSGTPITASEIEPALRLFAQMSVARHLERVETELVQRGEAFFHVGGDGHEASAALARHLVADDYLHLHYRDKALMLARGMTPADFLHALVCTARS